MPCSACTVLTSVCVCVCQVANWYRVCTLCLPYACMTHDSLILRIARIFIFQLYFDVVLVVFNLLFDSYHLIFRVLIISHYT